MSHEKRGEKDFNVALGRERQKREVGVQMAFDERLNPETKLYYAARGKPNRPNDVASLSPRAD